jgi:hypothetical protein
VTTHGLTDLDMDLIELALDTWRALLHQQGSAVRPLALEVRETLARVRAARAEAEAEAGP